LLWILSSLALTPEYGNGNRNKCAFNGHTGVMA